MPVVELVFDREVADDVPIIDALQQEDSAGHSAVQTAVAVPCLRGLSGCLARRRSGARSRAKRRALLFAERLVAGLDRLQLELARKPRVLEKTIVDEPLAGVDARCIDDYLSQRLTFPEWRNQPRRSTEHEREHNHCRLQDQASHPSPDRSHACKLLRAYAHRCTGRWTSTKPLGAVLRIPER